MTRRRSVLTALVVLLVLSACTMRMTVGLEINADGSGQISVIQAFDSEMRDLLELDAPEPIDWSDPSSFDVDLEDFPGLEEIVPYEEGDFIGFEATGSFASDADFEDSPMEITVEGDKVTFAVAEALFPEEDLEGTEGMPEEFLRDALDVSMTVKMPGRVTDHNADEVAIDGTLIWHFDVTGAQEEVLPKAVSSTSGGSGGSVNPLWVFLGIGVAAGIGAFVMFRKYKRETTPVSASPVEGEGAAPSPGGSEEE